MVNNSLDELDNLFPELGQCRQIAYHPRGTVCILSMKWRVWGMVPQSDCRPGFSAPLMALAFLSRNSN
jgi:hypothetical protein